MFITCWSVKGGSGTTVVAACLALLQAHRGIDTTLVDLAGDLPACLGMAEPSSAGVVDWLEAPAAVHPSAIAMLEIPVNDHLSIVPLGQGRSLHDVAPGSAPWERLVEALRWRMRSVVIDAGIGEPPPELLAAADHDLLVVRGCYMAMRRVALLHKAPDGVILLSEPGRALRRRDVEAVTGVPVIADLEWDPAVARAVDAGLLAGRIPRSLREGLEAISWTR